MKAINIFAVLNKRQKHQFVLQVFFTLAEALLNTFETYALVPVVYLLMAYDNLEDNKSVNKVMDVLGIQTLAGFIALLSFGIALVFFRKAIFQIFYIWMQSRFINLLRRDLSVQSFSMLAHDSYSVFTRKNTSDMERAIHRDCDGVVSLFSILFGLISNLLTTVMVVSVLIISSPMASMGILTVLFMVSIAISKSIGRRVQRAGAENRRIAAEMMQWFFQFSGSLKGILTNHKQDYFVIRYKEGAEQFARHTIGYKVLSGIPHFIVKGMGMCAAFLGLGILVSTGVNISSMLSIFVVFILAFIKLIPIVNDFSGSLITFRYYLPSLYAVQETFAAHKNTVFPRIREQKETLSMLEDGVSVSNLSFRFDDETSDLFHDISIRIPAGKSVAFIGKTGAGKTTLADIIIGLRRPYKGEIIVDGIDVLKETDWWAQQIGYIPQSIYLCDLSIMENVAFGVKKEDIDEDRVWDCLEKAQLKEFVEGLKDDIHTMTGENGVRLSGGQRQRIGIARALYENPPFLVMDEATSALDNDTEAAIVESINNLAGEKTLLIIAHRLSTIKDCDYIYKIENGSIELQSRKGGF